MRCIACVLGLVLLVGCGGGGGGDDGGGASGAVPLTVLSTASLDGVAHSWMEPWFSHGSGYPKTGDLGGSDRSWSVRQIYSFDISAIPAGARILNAWVRLYQARVDGDPYGKIGNVIVDHVWFDAAVGVEIYDLQSLARNVGTLSTSTDLEYKTLNVTSSVQGNLDRSDRWSQFRIRFYDDGVHFIDDVSDNATFTDAEDTCCAIGHPPMLVLEYVP